MKLNGQPANCRLIWRQVWVHCNAGMETLENSGKLRTACYGRGNYWYNWVSTSDHNDLIVFGHYW